MNKFYKMHKYIQGFTLKIQENVLTASFDDKSNISQIKIVEDSDYFHSIETVNGISHPVFDFKKEHSKFSYNIIDALRDSLLDLTGECPEFINHHNKEDKIYLENIKSKFIQGDFLEFYVRFNSMDNPIIKPYNPMNPYKIKCSAKDNYKNYLDNLAPEILEPYLYIWFPEPVAFYSKIIPVNSKNFGLCVKDKDFYIYAYSDCLEPGLCLFEKSSENLSFFDLYDVFDLLYVFINCVQTSKSHKHEVTVDEDYYDDKEIPFEL